MIKLLYGKAGYLIKQEQDRIVRDFAQKNPEANVDKFDVEDEWQLEKVKESLMQGGGLFSTKKLVIIKNINKANKRESEEITEKLKQFIGKESDVQVALTAGDKPPKKEKIFRLLFSKGETQEFKNLQGQALQKWMAGEVAKLSENEVKVDNNVLPQLELLFGKDLWQLSNVLNVLVNFCSDKKMIELEDVDRVTRGRIDAKIFDFIDAIGTKNKEKAINLFYSLLAQGENGFYILSMILFQLRNLVKVYSVAKKGVTNPDVVSRQLSLHPFVAKKTLGQLRNFSSKELKRSYQEIADLDFQAKTGEKTVEEGVVDFIAGL